ncbi:MAG: glycoside hydrolase family 2 protein [Sediminibacterium sp.]|nr:glycoside hydrolase family 2 protein [Sediminibacterium sp.]
MKVVRFIIGCLFLFQLKAQMVSRLEWKINWQFRKSGDSVWHKASVPGTVHTDLLSQHLIPDPFLEDNEQKMQWVEETDWEYTSVLEVDESFLKRQNIQLLFHGLDTYATVYLNGVKILTTNNMFRSWTVDVKRYLTSGKNTVLVRFDAAVKRGREMAKHLPYTLPGDERVFTRKAQYQYGWDWGPRLVTCGIWKKVECVAWDAIRIERFYIGSQKLSSQKADLTAILEVNCTTAGTYTVNITEPVTQRIITTQIMTLTEGLQTVKVPFVVKNPRLWWCNGMGPQTLYTFQCSVKGSKQEDAITLTTGLRTIQLIQKPDAKGKQFYFKLNGVPVFMKGANWIPADNFVTRVNKQEYELLIKKAAEANMNMLRVWGGGMYEDDIFYQLCNQYGILVWQDFMFACAMYPGDTAFVENVKQEAAEAIKRLTNHPSLALWCGNNENDEGWKNWGWQKQYHYTPQDSGKIWNDYLRLFHKELPELVAMYAPQNAYWPSSPSIGWGRKESLLQGDAHYWGVWWGMEPFEVYKQKVGRFMSEYGFQSMPSSYYYSTFCSDTSLNAVSVKWHQKHPRGFETIKAYMEREYKKPSSFSDYAYVSQLLQAGGMKTAIQAHRRAMPYCMGTLFWQWNDCWPVASWSAIDGSNSPKALYYEVKRSFREVLISVTEEDSTYAVYIISDRPTGLKGTLSLRILDATGKVAWRMDKRVIVPHRSSGSYFKIPKSVLKGYLLRELVLNSELHSEGGELLARDDFFFVKALDLALKPATIHLKVDTIKNTIVLSSDVLAKDVQVYTSEGEVWLEDNFFTVLPGERRTIKIMKGSVNGKTLRVRSLNSVFFK